MVGAQSSINWASFWSLLLFHGVDDCLLLTVADELVLELLASSCLAGELFVQPDKISPVTRTAAKVCVRRCFFIFLPQNKSNFSLFN